MSDANPEKQKPVVTSAFVSRRQFIQMGIAVVGVAWGGVLVQSRLFPSQSGAAEAKPVEIPLADLPVGGAKTFLYAGAPAIVLRTPESLRAFSLVCTHLGCTVNWQPDQKTFHCPCHDGIFDQFGEVTSGPPPLPLEALPVRVEGDKVIVGEL